MIDVKKLIPSAEVREYIAECGHRFSLLDEAALIFQNPILREDVRLDALRAIAAKLRENPTSEFKTQKDDGVISAEELALQIDAHVRADMETETALFQNSLGGVYEVSYSMKSDSLRGGQSEAFSPSCFSCIERAAEAARADAGENLSGYKITLRELDGDKCVCGFFNACGGLLRVDSSFSFVAYDSDNRLDNFYVEIPYPFKDGDIVREVHSGRVGVVNHLGGEWMAKNIVRRYRDASHIEVPTDCLDEDGEFVYEPMFTPCVEEARVDEKSSDGEYLTEAALLVQGKGSLEYFTHLVKQRLAERE